MLKAWATSHVLFAGPCMSIHTDVSHTKEEQYQVTSSLCRARGVFEDGSVVTAWAMKEADPRTLICQGDDGDGGQLCETRGTRFPW